jgi:hypothetical protein
MKNPRPMSGASRTCEAREGDHQGRSERRVIAIHAMPIYRSTCSESAVAS